VSQIVEPPAILRKLKDAEPSSTGFGNGPAIDAPLTLGDWLDREQSKGTHDLQSIESLYVQAVSFLERHLRERLQIADDAEVVIGFDPSRTRPRDSRNDSNGWARSAPAHGLPDSVALRDLYPEFKGTGSLKSILLYEDPVEKVDKGWSSVATITVEYILDRWCVTAVLVWGGADTAQARAADLFLPKSRVDGVDLREHPAYNNVLETDYPAPGKDKKA